MSPFAVPFAFWNVLQAQQSSHAMSPLSQLLTQLIRGIRSLITWQHLQRLFVIPIFPIKYGASLLPDGLAGSRKQPSYIYRSLESDDHIRVLELLPSDNPEATIQCKLHHTSINHCKYSYTAISYVWGPKSLPKKSINCEGHHAYIPPSLHSALSRLRSGKRQSQFLWADAICIEQGESGGSEKARQVRMMDQIFTLAEEVVIDLGVLDEDMLPILANLDHYQAIPMDKWSLITSSASVTSALDLLAKEDLPDISPNFWTLFQHFLQRPWFTRVWVIQEFALARAARFMIGEDFRGGDYLETAIVRAALHMTWQYQGNRCRPTVDGQSSLLWDGLYDTFIPVNAIQRMIQLKNRSKDKKYTFCELISMSTVLFNATNIRDRAYALMGLASDSEIKSRFAVSYEEDEGDTMLRVSRYLCRAGFSIFPLYHCIGVRRDDCRSWALNLEDKIKDDLSLLVVASGKTQPPHFNTCGEQLPYSCSFSQVRSEGLLIRGCMYLDIIDTSMEHSLPQSMSLTSQKPAAAYSGWLIEAFDWMCSTAQHYGLNREQQEKFFEHGWRTLIADIVKDIENENFGEIRYRDWENSSRCLKAWAKLWSIARNRHGSTNPQTAHQILSEEELRYVNIYGDCLEYAFGRRLGLSKERKLLCLIPADAKNGDHIVLVQGCQIPFVFRPGRDEHGEFFRIVGCVYVHGIMDGELVKREGWNVRDLEIW